jgi:hypothetical protein
MGGNTCCPCGWSLDICGCIPPNCECISSPIIAPACD